MSRTAGGHRDGGRRVVLVVDHVSGEADAYGPMPVTEAQPYAARVALDLDSAGVEGVEVAVVTLVEPEHPSRTHPPDRGCRR
jgi:hypothetical protein